MKYIRTINEIMDLTYCRHFANEHRYWNGKDCYSFEESEVIKTADTIKELCDEFVVKSNEEGNNFVKIYSQLCLMKKDIFYRKYKEHYNFYGAIWTDKGLIYVAKANEKGELELL